MNNTEEDDGLPVAHSHIHASLPVASSLNSRQRSEQISNLGQGEAIYSFPSGNENGQRNMLPVAYSTDTFHHNPNERSNISRTNVREDRTNVFTPDAPRNFYRSHSTPIRCICPFCGVLLLVQRSYGLIQCGNCRSLLSLGENGVPSVDLLLQSHSIGTCYGCNRFIIFPSGATSVRCGGCGTITVMTPRNMLSSAMSSTSSTSRTGTPSNQRSTSSHIQRSLSNSYSGANDIATATNSLDSSNVDRSRPTRHCICRKCGIRLLFQGSPQRVQCGSCGFVTTLIEPLPTNSGVVILENPSTEATPKLLFGKLIAKGRKERI
ncbi:hypothetical protein Gasu2_57360 [Galdieria sulphuraria]|uniref:Zinc finger LSD1-type domain-containing protein n=1 Tax=Galdieria sulphuraria TaxID=130081 RepID=M2W367_GALSU|nr:uncharacterized protein Gasu_25230 [Galdieria sulphuraria]EME30146.1 hypothetical protein Gasu_25230 [Galdieria sulphuraria]GJD11605.1 hypothetical protein Gasu2_57360 [Galdieria sulphuraria]|eukprot:XP_005706666.1 hypothetical protein Gasu_25230 [Galdieria sulphuraria]